MEKMDGSSALSQPAVSASTCWRAEGVAVAQLDCSAERTVDGASVTALEPSAPSELAVPALPGEVPKETSSVLGAAFSTLRRTSD